MARVDDYRQAFALARRGLESLGAGKAAQMSGGLFERDTEGREFVRLKFLGRGIRILWTDMALSYDDDAAREMPIQEQVLLLHYLQGCSDKGGAVVGEWIGFQDIPDGKFYLDAFMRRAKIPLVQSFGHRPELLAELSAQAYGAKASDQGDVSVVVRALPLVPVALILWRGDDEFPPEGNILFDRSVKDILSAEDVAWLSGMLVYPLIGMARNR